jgi:hypothetical protein
MGQLLEGVRVVDLARVLTGPFCCEQLAVRGTEVIRGDAWVRRTRHGCSRRLSAPPQYDVPILSTSLSTRPVTPTHVCSAADRSGSVRQPNARTSRVQPRRIRWKTIEPLQQQRLVNLTPAEAGSRRTKPSGLAGYRVKNCSRCFSHSTGNGSRSRASPAIGRRWNRMGMHTTSALR